MRSLLKTLLIAVVAVLLVKLVAFTSCTIPSEGMENTLYRGDRVIVNRWSYGYRTPLASFCGYHRLLEAPVHRNDIVLFNRPSGGQTSQEDGELFINRCVGLPGDTLRLNEELMLVDADALTPDGKFLYAYPGEQEALVTEAIRRAGIVDNALVGYDEGDYLRSFSLHEINAVKRLLGNRVTFCRPLAAASDRVHAFVVPGKGVSVRVHPWNAMLLRNTIVMHEGKRAEVKGDTLLVDGHPVASYRFSKDYYWMASNNSMSLCDSRLFGFVPKECVIGKATWVWFSKDPTQNLFSGYRLDRLFHKIN